MKTFAVATAIGALMAPVLAAKGNLKPVEVKGNAFWRGDERFYVRGVAYQPGMRLREVPDQENFGIDLLHRWLFRCKGSSTGP